MSPAASRAYRILIADDHSVVRKGLRILLTQPGVEICGEATTGPETIQLAKENKPNLVILDLAMPGMNGLEAAKVLREECPETDVMVLTMHLSDELAREALKAGVKAYVLKSDADTDLLAAVDHARHKQPFFTGQLATSMMHTFMVDSAAANGVGEGGITLTARELEVVQLLAEGKSNKQVAATLQVSIRTVESHRNHINHKMGFGSFSDMVRFAVRNNLVEA